MIPSREFQSSDSHQQHSQFLFSKLLHIMADQSRTTRKIRQGKVDIDYDDSSLIVHYDMELVRVFREAVISLL